MMERTNAMNRINKHGRSVERNGSNGGHARSASSHRKISHVHKKTLSSVNLSSRKDPNKILYGTARAIASSSSKMRLRSKSAVDTRIQSSERAVLPRKKSDQVSKSPSTRKI